MKKVHGTSYSLPSSSQYNTKKNKIKMEQEEEFETRDERGRFILY